MGGFIHFRMAGKLFCLCLLLVGFCPTWAKKQSMCLKSASNCEECLQSGPECAWCSVPQSRFRCHNFEGLHRSGCLIKNIYYPQGRVKIVENDSSTKPENATAPFLLPQELSLSLRPGVSQSFNVTITMPTDQPTTELNIDTSPVPEGVNITFSSAANGNTFDVQVNVEAAKCPTESDDSNQKQNQTGPWSVHIIPRGFSQRVKLGITLECQCDCTSNREENSPHCGHHGTLVCGQCECNEPYIGPQCRTNSLFSTKDDLCRSGPNAPVCSGRGQCLEESFCECERPVNPAERYSGRYCECSNLDCPIFKSRLCGGHGKCECGLCVCDPGWTGEDCSCTMDTAPCMAPNNMVCSDNGKCRCGVCVCDLTYAGSTCEYCMSVSVCGNPCSRYAECVDCLAFKMGPKKDTCEQDCGHLTFRKTRKFFESHQEGISYCKNRNNEDDCHFYFTLTRMQSGEYAIDAVDYKDCPSPFLVPF